MSTIFHWGLLLLWLPALLACAYLLVLTLWSSRPVAPPSRGKNLYFDIVVPAHNEAAGIERTLASLQRLDWPPEQMQIIVVADNCTDNTAELARAAGADVIERTDENLRGKGYALRHGFNHCQYRGWADAVVVVDADSEVSPNLLTAIAARLEDGAHAVQAHYAVLNGQASWRTQLMVLAQTCFHAVRSRAREQLGLSCGLRGNGWCVSMALLRAVPYRAYTLAEDVEYGIDIGLRNLRVHYVEEGEVRGEMVSTSDAARSQRRRWEDGRRLLQRNSLGRLLRAARDRSSWMLLDLALDLLLPPLATVVGYSLLLSAISLVTGQFLWAVAFCWTALLLHVARGWQLSGLGMKGLRAIAHVPGYLWWKLRLKLEGGASRDWIRTRREAR